MAQRRMFSLRIVDTDVFLEMPLSARLLYYDLGMRADDDGFVSAPKKIQKIIGCSDDDFKILIAKQFIIPFDSGICVIRHWKKHNYIRVDRYNPTDCIKEKLLLSEVDGIYELSSNVQNVIPTNNQMDTQVSLDKDKLDKERSEYRNGEIKRYISTGSREIDTNGFKDKLSQICK